MKAIVIAAGLGSRMKDLTAEKPKCLLEVNGSSILERQLHAFRAVGIEDISIVTGYRAHLLSKVQNVKTYHNDKFRQNNILLSLMYAKDELDSEVLICYSDLVFGEELLRQVIPLKSDLSVVIDEDWRQGYVGRTEHPEAEAEKVISLEGKVASIGKQLLPSLAQGEFIGMLSMSAVGCQIWTESFDQVQAKYAGKPFGQAKSFERAYVTDFLQELVNRGIDVRTVSVTAEWSEIDTLQDFTEAQKLFPHLESGEK